MNVPLADIEAEAERLVDGMAERDQPVRLIGGLAIAQHRHTAVPAALSRSYGDIDIVVGPGAAAPFRDAMEDLGYVGNKRFNNMRGDRRMLFYDEPNGRQVDVFVGRFDMCHGIDLRTRLSTADRALFPTDLLLTKLQVVEINRKDQVDALTLLLTHEVVAGAQGVDGLETGRLVEVTAGDWGWFTTFTDNLWTLPEVGRQLLASDQAAVVTSRADALLKAVEAAPKSLRWKARAKVGRKVKWYELPEEMGQAIVTR
jgi:Uncharacterised nucleotidyltransferase